MPAFKPDKSKLIAQIVAELERELEALERSARAAHEAATHEESKAEDKYDTRGLEASYLAGAQAGRVAELHKQIVTFRQLPARELAEGEPVVPGAIVELECEGRRQWVFLAPQGGGVAVELDGGVRVQVITPAAPLGEALSGRRAGEVVEVETRGGGKEYEIVKVF